MSAYPPAGSELELFARARNWKRYCLSLIKPFLTGNILEVGCGIGSNTRLLSSVDFERWVCLEPDQDLLSRVTSDAVLSDRYELIHGLIDDLDDRHRFDAILYLDVLEHIEDDRAELMKAARFLNSDGVLIVLAPAHQWLFSPFDTAVGHYRRYTCASLRKITPSSLSMERCIYIDSCGTLASAANRLVLRSKLPSPAQLQVWDRLLIPLSRLLDPILCHRFGKSVLSIWRLAEV